MVTLSSLRRLKETQQGTSGLDSAQVSSIAGSGVSVYETLDSLPSTGLTAGDEAYVKGNSRLYVSNGSGWYNTTLVNRNPRWDSGGEPDASYTIVDSATPLIITARAIDSDNGNLLNQAFASDSAQYMVDISSDSSVFTFTPKSADSIGSEVSSGNLTDSNGDFVYTFKWSDGVSFVSKAVTIEYNPTGGSGGVWYGDRGLSTFQGNNQIDYFDITTASDAADFGDMPYNTYYVSANISNGEKQLFTGGSNQGNTISYVSSATLGNAQDFGDMTRDNYGTANTSSSTRGIIAGGANPPNDVGQGWNGIEYVTIDPAAHAVNFGNLAQSREHGSGVSDGTYAGICGGQAPAGINNIDKITIDTTGNASDFGDLTFSRRYLGGHGISSKCTTAGGENSSGFGDYIEEFTLDTNQNATYYGDLTVARQNHGVTGNASYGVAVGGITAGDAGGTTYNVIDRWSMSSSGNASDHGDLQFARKYGCAVSGAAA